MLCMFIYKSLSSHMSFSYSFSYFAEHLVLVVMVSCYGYQFTNFLILVLLVCVLNRSAWRLAVTCLWWHWMVSDFPFYQSVGGFSFKVLNYLYIFINIVIMHSFVLQCIISYVYFGFPKSIHIHFSMYVVSLVRYLFRPFRFFP